MRELTNRQIEFFTKIKSIKDTAIGVTSAKIETKPRNKSEADIFNEIGEILKTEEERELLLKVLGEVIDDVIIDILVTIDGYSNLSYDLDLIEKENGKSIRDGIELHDTIVEFI